MAFSLPLSGSRLIFDYFIEDRTSTDQYISFTSDHSSRMPITELVFPSYKLDLQSRTRLKEKASDIFQIFSGVEGLQAAFRGAILEENGAAVDPNSVRTVFVLGRLPQGRHPRFLMI